MTESAAVPAEPTKIPPPVAAGSQGAGALAEGPLAGQTPDDPFEFDLDIKGQKQKLKFANKDQLKAVLQKALYSDQLIKDASQAKKGAEALMQKLKTTDGLKEVLSDPAIGLDMKKFALEIVQGMMDDEKLTPEQRENRELKLYREQNEAEKKARSEAEKTAEETRKRTADAQAMRGQIIEAMKKYPDIPQDQYTMDGIIQNMRAAFRRFNKHLTPDQAMSVYSEQYWKSHLSLIEKMTPEQLEARFGKKTLDKIQQLKLNELRTRTNPANQKPQLDGEVKKKKHITEKEFEKHFQQLAGGL